MNKGGFSLKRFVGITRLKRSLGATIGIPLTKTGRQRKVGGLLWKTFKRVGK